MLKLWVYRWFQSFPHSQFLFNADSTTTGFDDNRFREFAPGQRRTSGPRRPGFSNSFFSVLRVLPCIPKVCSLTTKAMDKLGRLRRLKRGELGLQRSETARTSTFWGALYTTVPIRAVPLHLMVSHKQFLWHHSRLCMCLFHPYRLYPRS